MSVLKKMIMKDLMLQCIVPAYVFIYLNCKILFVFSHTTVTLCRNASLISSGIRLHFCGLGSSYLPKFVSWYSLFEHMILPDSILILYLGPQLTCFFMHLLFSLSEITLHLPLSASSWQSVV